jgi:hypothetical protein
MLVPPHAFTYIVSRMEVVGFTTAPVWTTWMIEESRDVSPAKSLNECDRLFYGAYGVSRKRERVEEET